MYYTWNVAVGNYFGIQISKIEENDRQLRSELDKETAELHGKDLNESGDQFTVMDVLLSENLVILSVKNLQILPYEDEEVTI